MSNYKFLHLWIWKKITFTWSKKTFTWSKMTFNGSKLTFTWSQMSFTFSMLVRLAWIGPPAPDRTGWDTCSASLAPSLCFTSSSIWIRPYCPKLQQQPAAVQAHFSPNKYKRPSKKCKRCLNKYVMFGSYLIFKLEMYHGWKNFIILYM